MSIVLCLNELSCGTDVERQTIDYAMAEFVEVLRSIRRWRGDVSLLSAIRLPGLELSAGYYMQQWINSDPKNRVRWDFIRSLQNRAPFTEVLSDDLTGLIEYKFKGTLAEGLGTADLISGLAISLAVDDVWDASYLELNRLVVFESSNGEEEREDEVRVRHAMRTSQAEEHRIWLEESQRGEVTSGADIWDKRQTLFPSLSFLPRVEADLRGLAGVSVKFVCEKLSEIDAAMSEWRASGSALPPWKAAVKPEYEGRERYCQFEDIDGELRVFELHVRFPPRPGRIHFRLVDGERSARIAYVGRKLGV